MKALWLFRSALSALLAVVVIAAVFVSFPAPTLAQDYLCRGEVIFRTIPAPGKLLSSLIREMTDEAEDRAEPDAINQFTLEITATAPLTQSVSGLTRFSPGLEVDCLVFDGGQTQLRLRPFNPVHKISTTRTLAFRNLTILGRESSVGTPPRWEITTMYGLAPIILDHVQFQGVEEFRWLFTPLPEDWREFETRRLYARGSLETLPVLRVQFGGQELVAFEYETGLAGPGKIILEAISPVEGCSPINREVRNYQDANELAYWMSWTIAFCEGKTTLVPPPEPVLNNHEFAQSLFLPSIDR